MSKEKTCFVIMPIADDPEYLNGHFFRVYEYLIKPSVLKAGFTPIRADEIKQTNVIVIDILKRIINSDMAICDLSGRNPNVLYELGIRQAFDLPVSLIKDEKTKRIFDIQGFRDFEYNSNLRIDEVNLAVESLSEIIKNTYEQKDSDVNSIIDLLKINKAQISEEVNLSPEANLIIEQLQDLRYDINKLRETNESKIHPQVDLTTKLNNGVLTFSTKDGKFFTGSRVEHPKFGIGTVTAILIESVNEKITIDFIKFGEKTLLYGFAKLKNLDNATI